MELYEILFSFGKVGIVFKKLLDIIDMDIINLWL